MTRKKRGAIIKEVQGVELCWTGGDERVNKFEKMALRNELFNRGITLQKAAEITGIEAELLQRSFDGDRELSANELVAILTGTGIPIEKIIYKEPEITGVKILEWNPGEEMSKEYAISTVEYTMQFYRRLYYQPQMKPFSCEADFVGRMQELNGLKEMIIKLYGE